VWNPSSRAQLIVLTPTPEVTGTGTMTQTVAVMPEDGTVVESGIERAAEYTTAIPVLIGGRRIRRPCLTSLLRINPSKKSSRISGKTKRLMKNTGRIKGSKSTKPTNRKPSATYNSHRLTFYLLEPTSERRDQILFIKKPKLYLV
jgi:hypothetical protein